MKSRCPLPARISAAFQGLGALLLFVVMAVVLVDVFGRNLLDRPLPWGTELLEVMLAAMIFLLYPVLALDSEHITVDLIPVPAAIRAVQRSVGAIVGTALFSLISGCLIWQATRAADYGEGTPLLGIPYSAVLGGMGALAMAGALAFMVGAVRTIGKPKQAPFAQAAAMEGV